jgi:hypothetical protein
MDMNPLFGLSAGGDSSGTHLKPHSCTGRHEPAVPSDHLQMQHKSTRHRMTLATDEAQ